MHHSPDQRKPGGKHGLFVCFEKFFYCVTCKQCSTGASHLPIDNFQPYIIMLWARDREWVGGGNTEIVGHMGRKSTEGWKKGWGQDSQGGKN